MTFAVNSWFPKVNFCEFYHVSFTCQRHGFIEFISCFLRFDLILWALHFCEEPNKVPFDFKTLRIFWMNNKTITVFGFCIIWRILHISEVVVVYLSLWQITTSLIGIILQIMHSIIVLLLLNSLSLIRASVRMSVFILFLVKASEGLTPLEEKKKL